MKLQRATQGPVAYGVLRDDEGKIFFTTLERFPIPAGTYVVKWMPAEANPIHGECYEVQNVPGRSDILFHSGNIPDHSKGCIIVGKGYDNFGKTAGVVNSTTALERLIRFLGKKDFTLEIADSVL